MHEQDNSQQKIKLSTWKTILHEAGTHRKYFILIITCGMALGIMNLLASLLNMHIIDHFMEQHQLAGFVPVAILVVLIQLVYAFLALGFCNGAGRLETHLTADVRMRTFEKLQTMSFSYYDKMSVGYLLSRLTSDVARTMETISWSCIDVGFGLMSILAAIVGMFLVNPGLSVIIMLSVPPLALVSVLFQKLILKHQRQTRKLNSMITSVFNEGITGASTTKTLVREDLNLTEFTDITAKHAKSSFRASMVSALYLPVASLLISFATAAVLYAGGMEVREGLITIGELNFFINIGNMMFEPIRGFASIFAEFQSSQAAAERVADVLLAVPDIVVRPEVAEKYGDLFDPKTENWEDISGEVTFDHVYFRYGAEPILEDFNLKVQAGETIALVGETGSGKSTIVNLVCRFYEPQQGQILMDGVDIRQRSQLWLQSQLGYVLQTPHLFSGTIRENIRYGRLNASDDEIMDAAKLLGADDFIRNLSEGYDTQVGEGGSLLSTGQKQLISFARAILADPKIFILDEATSSIDTESEMQIQTAIEKILATRTSFVVAHRLSTIRGADRILVIDGSRILEMGNHTELMAKKGRYYELYMGHTSLENVNRSLEILDA